MTDGLLRDEVVVHQRKVRQGLFEFGGTGKAGLLAKFADTAVESLNHAVRLGMAGRDETVLDPGVGAGLVEDVMAGRLFLAESEAIGEWCAVVRQYRANTDRAGRLQALEEIQVARFAPVIVDMQGNPAAGAIDRWRRRDHAGRFRRVSWEDTRYRHG
jgi:hypothetical protein